MNVSPNHNTGPVTRAYWKNSTTPPAGSPLDTAQFSHAAALDRALADTPELRASEVERARGLIGNVAYPPTEMIHRIAKLLALNSEETSE